MKLIPRQITSRLKAALKDSPIIYLSGPRQAGKSTLSRSLGEEFNYLTFDKISTQNAASSDPTAFINNMPAKTIIDEVQLVPEIFRPIKYFIDEARLNNKKHIAGYFILTGSSNIMAIPSLSESLVGRMQVITLLPFSAAEILGGNTNFISSIFAKNPSYKKFTTSNNLYDIIHKATFPEVALGKLENKQAWYENYISNIMNRDIKALADIEKITQLPRMLTLLANRVGNLLSHASFARDTDLSVSTYKRYLTLFQHVYLVTLIQPWFRNINKRLVKSPKIYLTDTGLLLALLGKTSIDDCLSKGAILENFVASELTKHIEFLGGYRLFHFRTQDNIEADFVIERQDGALIGIEVKYSSTVTASDFKGLKALQKIANKDFIRGVVLYQGDEILSFGENLFAMPISCLYEG
jgi:predicted AAA+ superfamily ATPase